MSAEKNPFRRFGGFLKNIFFRGRKSDSGFEAYSKFKHFFEGMDHSDPLYPSVLQASSLCDDALRIAKRRIRLSSRLQNIDERLNELESFNNLTEDEIAELKRLLDRFLSLTKERSQLLHQLSDYDNSLIEMFNLEEDATVAMPQIKDAEKHQRALRQDIGYLQGEKEELIGERADMNRTLQFIHRFTLSMVGVFIFATLLLLYMYVYSGWDIFVTTSILILLVMAIVALLYFFRQRIRTDMRRNLRKQHRAVELLNKKNVVFAYYTNYLRYSYKKYKVKNSRMLETNLKDFGSYKFLANRIDVCRSLMYETEESIEHFMREKKLTGIKATIEGFAKTVNLDDKKRYYNEVLAQKTAVEKELSELDARHEEIWETLMKLNERDHSHNHIIETILTTYLEEAGKLFNTTAEEIKEQNEAQQSKETREGGAETTGNGTDEAFDFDDDDFDDDFESDE
jgi:hypothetical protein